MPTRCPCAAAGALCLAVILPSLAAGEDRRSTLDVLSVATFNARFLFDGRSPEGRAGFPWKGDPIASRRHLQDVARILRDVDADILHLSEVEDLRSLERLRLEIGDPSYRAYFVAGRDTFTRQNVGLLTRIDPTTAMFRTERTATVEGTRSQQGVSKHYAAIVDIGPLELLVVGVHFLALPEDASRTRPREAQARVIRQLCELHGRRNGRATVILGDINDYDSEVPDVAGNTPQSEVLAILRGTDRREAAAEPEPTIDTLVNVASHLPPTERFTAYVDRNQDTIDDGPTERSLTDHVLLSPELAATVTGVRVFADHSPPYPSDHFPMKVVLRVAELTPFLRGDLDGSGERNLTDAVLALSALFFGEPLDCHDAADVNDDGRLDLQDPLRLLNGLYELGPLPEPPAARRGADPTEDSLGCFTSSG